MQQSNMNNYLLHIIITSIFRRMQVPQPIAALLVLLSLATLGCTLSIDIPKSVVESNRKWTRVKIGLANATQPVEFFYDEYPEGWSQVLNFIYIPAEQRINNRKFPCRLRVRDGSGVEVKSTVVFVMSGEMVYLTQLLFPYDQTFDDAFFNTGIFSGRPSMVQASKMTANSIQGDSEQFLKQENIINMMNSVASTPGAGIAAVIQGIAENNSTVQLVGVEAAMKLRDDLKNGSVSTTQPATPANQQSINATTNNATMNSSGPVVIENRNQSNLTTNGSGSEVKSIQQAASRIPTVEQFMAGSSKPISLLASPAALMPSAPIILNGVLSTASLSPSTAASSPGSAQSQLQLAYLSQVLSSESSEKSQQRSIESIFFKLPGLQELDSIILSGDTFSIMKIIQNVIQSELTCEQKISYLSELLGRIQCAISVKSFAAMQLGVLVEGSTTEIDRINKQLDESNKALDKLGLKDLRDKLNKALIDLEQAYNAFNSADAQIPSKEALVAGYRKNIESVQSTTDSYRQQVPLDRIQLNELSTSYAQLQKSLQQALAKRDVFQTNINKLNASISQYDGNITEAKGKIDGLETEINKRLDQASKLKDSYQALEVTIETTKNILTTTEKRQAEIVVQLPTLEAKAAAEKQKLNAAQLEKTKALIQGLQLTLPTIKNKIDESNFRCNDVKEVQPIKTVELVKQSVELPKIEATPSDPAPTAPPTPTPPVPAQQIVIMAYQIPIREYHSYLSTCYRARPPSPNLQVPKATITPVGILDPLWRTNFGNPYTPDSYRRTKEFSFEEDFNCLNPESLSAGSGLIRAVSRKFIEMEDEGGFRATLNLGACSRLESTTQLPKVGQRIYFRARQVGRGMFNLYKGSCL